jgi:cytochrome c-type biogenesis protein CcmH/NrfG
VTLRLCNGALSSSAGGCTFRFPRAGRFAHNSRHASRLLVRSIDRHCSFHMNDDQRQAFKKHCQDASIEELQKRLNQLPLGAREYKSVVREVIEEKRRAADAPEQERFAASYEQKERHQRELKRVAQIAALVSIIGGAASWTGVWFQWHHSQAPTAPASLSPAVASPSPTQAADVDVHE